MPALIVSLPSAIAVASLLVSTTATPTLSVTTTISNSRQIAVQRIRAHFDSALRELPLRDVASLTPSQLSNCAQLVPMLRGFRFRTSQTLRRLLRTPGGAPHRVRHRRRNRSR